MKINSVNSLNQNSQNKNFGHTFRVSICTKDADGITSYISPAKNTKLYKQLNRRIVGFLNENFISDLRNVIGIQRRTVKHKTANETKVQHDIIQNLSEIDSDYRQAPFVRSVYPKGALGYIATGVDAPIIEEFMGADNIGVAKKMARESKLPIWESGAREISNEFQKKAHEYAKSPTQLLRSENNHEIMLRVIFDEIKGKRGGKSKYEFSEFLFDRLKTKPLPQLTTETDSIKKETNLDWAAGRYIKHSFDKIYLKNKPKLSPTDVIQARNKFAEFISKQPGIKHDLPADKV